MLVKEFKATSQRQKEAEEMVKKMVQNGDQ